MNHFDLKDALATLTPEDRVIERTRIDDGHRVVCRPMNAADGEQRDQLFKLYKRKVWGIPS